MKTSTELITEARALIAAAKAGTATPEQVQRMSTIQGEILARKAAEADGEALQHKLAGGKSAAPTEGGRLTKTGLQRTAQKLAAKAHADAGLLEAKAITVGSFDAPLTLVDAATLPAGPLGLLEQIPTTLVDGRHYSYLRQTSRATNAAIVAPGGLKPTSTLGLERVADELAVLAHVSEPVDEYLLSDVPVVGQVLSLELIHGLHVALEHQFLHGTGTGELTGVLGASGIQVLTTGARPIDRLRAALTRLEVQGHTAGVIALHPQAWEAIELATTTGSGEFVLQSSPVDVAARRLWGVSVATTTAVDVNEAVVFDPTAVGIATDGKVALHIGQPGETFQRNQVVFRCESRFGVMVKQAAGVVRVTLADAA